MKGLGCRRKGMEAERQLLELLTLAGVQARRVPLSGQMKASGFGGDLLVAGVDGVERTWEVKRRGRPFVQLEAWLSEASVVAFRADRGEWIVTLRLSDLLAALPREAAPGVAGPSGDDGGARWQEPR